MKNNKEKNHKSRLLILSGSILLALASCTKEVPFKALPSDVKEQTYEKSLLNSDEEYIYSSSQQTSSMSAADAFPFSASDNKRVKVRITEHTLQIVETERDQRYAGNENNNKLVLEIPITHAQFQCAKDRFGECKNEEEEATDIPWNQKQNIRIAFEDTKTGQLDLLPLVESQTWGDNCYKEVGTPEVVYSKVEVDAINFQVKRTFVTDIYCLGDISTLADASVSAVYHYSLVKAKSVLSKGYETISYPQGSKDESTFGFFTTSRVQRDVDHNDIEQSLIQIMNRWNPNRKVIDYYLSDEFAKPENKVINDMTVKAVDSINSGLAESGVNFKINLHQPAGKIPGDIRNSMIVLVEDPVASSVIGYGPQTEDPVTGEIISARTVMFLGTIKTFIKVTYDDIIRAKAEAKAKAAVPQTTPGLPASAPKLVLAQDTQSEVLTSKLNAKLKSAKTVNVKSSLNKILANKIGSGAISKPGPAVKINVANVSRDLKVYTRNRNDIYDAKDLKTKLKYLQEVKNCALKGADGISTSISQKLMDQFTDDAKPWVQLSDSEKQKVIDIILPEIWVPTLIHEMGHNLGLRHNFGGSEDKANFYSEDELKAKNIDHAIPFSSVMEYGDDLKALPILGKYDMAALRFGYKREVDVVNSQGKVSTVQVPSTLNALQLPAGSALKDYTYCTDEHVGINAGCRRFDLGSSYTEIVQNMIKDYEDAYARRNFRNGRASMSLMDDYAYAQRIGSIFKDLRVMMEVRERIKYRYALPEGNPIWEQVDFLKDLNQASILAGVALAQVIMTPDLNCAVVSPAAPTQVYVLRAKDIDPDAISCFTASFANGIYSQLEGQFLIIGQAGKMFNSLKDPTNPNPYVDQIDVRGYWIDKVQAINALFKRKTNLYKYERYPISTFEKNNDNFLDVDQLGQPILDLVVAIMNDNVSNELDFTLMDGSHASLETTYDMSTSQVIETHMSAPIAKILGINPDRPTKLQQLLAHTIAAEAKDQTGANQGDEILQPQFSVSIFKKTDAIKDLNKSVNVIINDNIYLATKDNVVAESMITNLHSAAALEALEASIPVDPNADPSKPSKLEEILTAMKNGQQKPSNSASAQEKAVWKLGADTIEGYLNGVVKPSAYYTDMVRVLPVVTSAN